MIGYIVVFILSTAASTIGGWSLAQLEDTRYKMVLVDQLNKRQQDELVLIQEVKGQDVLSAQEFATDIQRYLVIKGPQGTKGDKGDEGDIGATGATGATGSTSLGALTSDWNQTGAFDILLNNPSSELKILESSGDTYYATIEAGDLTSDAVYTFSGLTGTLLSSANYGSTLNSTYLQIANNFSDLSSVTSSRSNLGLVIGTNIQAYDVQLADIAGITPSDNVFVTGNGANFVGESDATARTSLGLGSIATQNANAIAISGGTLSGITDYSQSSGNFIISGTGTFESGTGAISLNGDTTIANGKTLTVTTADNLTVGGTKIPQTLVIPVNLTAAILDQHVFVADTSYQVTSVRCVYSVGALTGGTLQVRVNTGTDAPGSGTAQLTSTIGLSTTVNTTYTGTLIAPPTTMSAGDRLSIDIGGTLTGLLGSCTIGVKRV